VIKIMDTAVKLRWSEPRAPNGILVGYQIHLHDITNNLNDTRKLSDPQSVMEHSIGELTPFTWYRVHIQAYSRKFLGEPSQSVKFRTDVSAPSEPQMINVTCYSQDSILIQWQRPEKFYNQIDYYYVQYKPDSAWQNEETILSAKKDKLLNELLITNLTADLLYELKVLAGTKSLQDPNLVYKSDSAQTLRVVLQANCESKLKQLCLLQMGMFDRELWFSLVWFLANGAPPCGSSRKQWNPMNTWGEKFVSQTRRDRAGSSVLLVVRVSEEDPGNFLSCVVCMNRAIFVFYWKGA